MKPLEPANPLPGVTLGLVGKGITFDSGGISIKPAENMDKMKDDMSGAAAVLSAMTALARLQVPIRAVAVIPLAENMPGGRAFKPGDVLVSAEGKTVEVLNTDAEGRLLLGDALWYARRLGATHLVDVATLTRRPNIRLIDAGGWEVANFGDIYGDHEAVYHDGPQPMVSHYNNQYDLLLGFLVQFLVSGDLRWWQLAEPLARNVPARGCAH